MTDVQSDMYRPVMWKAAVDGMQGQAPTPLSPELLAWVKAFFDLGWDAARDVDSELRNSDLCPTKPL